MKEKISLDAFKENRIVIEEHEDDIEIKYCEFYSMPDGIDMGIIVSNCPVDKLEIKDCIFAKEKPF